METIHKLVMGDLKTKKMGNKNLHHNQRKNSILREYPL